MTKESKNMFKPLMIYTAIVFGIGVLYTVIADVSGFTVEKFKLSGLVGAAISSVMIVYSIYGYRKEYCNDQITYGQALGFGVLLAVTVGFLNGILSYYYIHYVSPEIQEVSRLITEEAMLKRGVTDAQIEAAMQNNEKFDNVVFSVIGSVIYSAIAGFVVSLIAAAFLKKEPKNPFEGIE